MSGTADHRLIGSPLRSPWRIERSSVKTAESIRGSVELSGSSGASGVLGGRLSESDPSWAADRVARHRTRRGSTWVDHVRSEWHVTRAGVTWDFRGGGRATW